MPKSFKERSPCYPESFRLEEFEVTEYNVEISREMSVIYFPGCGNPSSETWHEYEYCSDITYTRYEVFHHCYEQSIGQVWECIDKSWSLSMAIGGDVIEGFIDRDGACKALETLARIRQMSVNKDNFTLDLD